MSRQKHRAYRRVLKVERLEKSEGSLKFPVTIVTWVIIERENSKSIFTRHLGVKIYVGRGSRNAGVEAYISSKEFRVPKSLESSEQLEVLRSRMSKAYSHALFAYLGKTQKEREGKVIWFDKGRGVGVLEDEETSLSITFYACNFEGADSPHESLVTNVNVDRGDKLRYLIHKDPFVSLHCGATHLRAA